MNEHEEALEKTEPIPSWILLILAGLGFWLCFGCDTTFEPGEREFYLMISVVYLGIALSDRLSQAARNSKPKRSNKTSRPRLAIALLDIFLKEEEHDDFFLHFEEAFEKRRKRSGRLTAHLWVWRQVALTIGPLLWRIVRGAFAFWKVDEVLKKLF